MPHTINIERHKLNQAMYQKLKKYIMNKRKREREERAQDENFKRLKIEREERKLQAQLDADKLETTKQEINLIKKRMEELRYQRESLIKRYKQLSSEECNLKEKHRNETAALMANMQTGQFGFPPRTLNTSIRTGHSNESSSVYAASQTGTYKNVSGLPQHVPVGGGPHGVAANQGQAQSHMVSFGNWLPITTIFQQNSVPGGGFPSGGQLTGGIPVTQANKAAAIAAAVAAQQSHTVSGQANFTAAYLDAVASSGVTGGVPAGANLSDAVAALAAASGMYQPGCGPGGGGGTGPQTGNLGAPNQTSTTATSMSSAAVIAQQKIVALSKCFNMSTAPPGSTAGQPTVRSTNITGQLLPHTVGSLGASSPSPHYIRGGAAATAVISALPTSLSSIASPFSGVGGANGGSVHPSGASLSSASRLSAAGSSGPLVTSASVGSTAAAAASLLPPAPTSYRGSITTGQSAQQIQLQAQVAQQQHLVAQQQAAAAAAAAAMGQSLDEQQAASTAAAVAAYADKLNQQQGADFVPRVAGGPGSATTPNYSTSSSMSGQHQQPGVLFSVAGKPGGGGGGLPGSKATGPAPSQMLLVGSHAPAGGGGGPTCLAPMSSQPTPPPATTTTAGPSTAAAVAAAAASANFAAALRPYAAAFNYFSPQMLAAAAYHQHQQQQKPTGGRTQPSASPGAPVNTSSSNPPPGQKNAPGALTSGRRFY